MSDQVEVRVRAYSVGFGDAVVLTAQRAEQTFRMLIDCGVLVGGNDHRHPIDAIVTDIMTQAGAPSLAPRFDVVVASHRHRDHISGFADPRWRAAEVGEIWMPWTEDPADQLANELRLGLDTMARSLSMTFAADETALALALNSLTNEAAMTNLLHTIPAARRRFVSVEGPPVQLPLPFDGMSVWHLGPTRASETLRRKTAPKAERWLDVPAFGPQPPAPAPFDPTHQVDRATYSALYPHLDSSDKSLERVAHPSADALEAAAWLDRAVNNTSLFFALEVDNLVLAFPGDAQWGAWDHVLSDEQSRRLLAAARVYKVSHHASHNGTPRSFAEEILSDSAISILSVRDMPQWSELPKPDLVDQLSSGRRQLIRTDEPPTSTEADIATGPDGLWVEIVLHP